MIPRWPAPFSLVCLVIVFVAGCTASARTASRDATTTTSAPAERQSPAPFFDARSHQVEYAGPGRDEPVPADLDEVRIGWFGPSDPEHPTAGAMWCAATLALDEANGTGGCGGLPFRLVGVWSENPWGTGVKSVIRLAYDEKVWAIVGAPDGASAHLVEQVVAKARLTFVSAISTDKTTNLVNVPWIFSCAPGDHLQAPVLAEAIVSQAGGLGFVLTTCTDHDSRLATTELLAALNRMKSFAKRHLEFGPGSRDFASQLEAIRQARPGAVVVFGGPVDSARFVTALRQAGLKLPVFGRPAMGTRAFVEQAGEFAEGVLFPLLWEPAVAGEKAQQFIQRFVERFGVEPDYTAACTYDAMNLLMAAVRRAGLNRARIRDAVRELAPWSGVTGTIIWDPTGQNDRPVTLGTVQNAHAVPLKAGRSVPRSRKRREDGAAGKQRGRITR